GAEILRRGGNAVDAAVATSFALSVCRPASCGIGGGGFMVIWDAGTKTATSVDYRERAPAAAAPDMYAVARQRWGTPVEPYSVRGGLAVGIPGTPAGLCWVAERYGTLPLHELIAPAIALCEDGVPVDEHDREIQQSVLKRLATYPDGKTRFAPLIAQYLNGGTLWKPGDRFYSPQRAVLERIATQGAAGFYSGEVAQAICDAVTAHNGLMQPSDLSSSIPVERDVLSGQFHGHRILSMRPPSSGGVALIQTLQSLEEWEQQHRTPLLSLKHNSPRYVHTVTEALKHAFADRAEYLGDEDFVQVPIARLVSRKYAVQTAQRIHDDRVLSSEEYGRFVLQPDGGTSHFSVIDQAGNAVACTETINLTFGSFVVVPEFGIVLNNQMDDFAANPGEPNAFGLIQSEANAVAPGKKPLSSMTPTIVVRDDQAVLACGASGGPRIISATLQTVLNHLVFQMTADEAVNAPRFHHQWAPDQLLLEAPLADITDQLSELGHQPQRSSSLAAAQAATRSLEAPFAVGGGSDQRKHGQPALVTRPAGVTMPAGE
ncbi:MAG: gamma-glutamyltransferase, partial [Planctomycetaceae bacterium]|nr:gamma-glutamyltransferase [Planctomycetaceae bacterium]